MVVGPNANQLTDNNHDRADFSYFILYSLPN